jgi:hypothetical protein
VFKLEKDLGLSLESQKIELSDHHILNNVDMVQKATYLIGSTKVPV